MMTITMNTSDAKEEFTDLVNRVGNGKERIILTRRGKEIAALISLSDLKLLQDSQDKEDLQDAIDALKEARSAGTISLDQFKIETGT